jgi:putative phosphoesterase
MRIAVLSDIHDNVWRLASALEAVRGADVLICAGDLCSPFVVHQLGRGFQGPIHIVFGNNDGDLYRIANNARRYNHIHLHGEFFRGEFEGRRVAANHYDQIARAVAASGEFDVVCFGHNHVYEVSRIGRTLALNPGAIMGATFAADGTRTEVPSTFLIYDTATDQAAGFEVAASGEVQALSMARSG